MRRSDTEINCLACGCRFLVYIVPENLREVVEAATGKPLPTFNCPTCLAPVAA